MPKRKRADSKARSPLSLTRENLDRLQVALSGSPAWSSSMSRTPSPNRKNTTLDAREKLQQYCINIDTGKALPAELAAHIDSVVRKPRDPSVALSPNAKKVVERRRFAARQNEATGIRQIATYMLFSGEAEMDDRVESVPLIISEADVPLNRFFLPPAPDRLVKDTWKELSQPKPDSCVGYISCSDAAASNCDAPFSVEEECILSTFVLTRRMLFPFVSAQWKSPNGREGLYCAQNQAARDGAAIVNHLHDFYKVAYGEAPSCVAMCHFSLVADLQYGEIWVHWREAENHYMEQVHYFSFRDQAAVETARGILRNIRDYALGERLQSIRTALEPFARNRSAGLYPSVPASEVSAPGSDISQLSSAPNFAFRAPPTPSSLVSEPVKKRSRLDDSSVRGG